MSSFNRSSLVNLASTGLFVLLWSSAAIASKWGLAHASPFVHPALVRAWLEAKGGEASFQPCFLWATHPSGQELFWPLVVVAGGWRHGFVRRLLPVGAALRPFRPGGTLYDYHEPAVAPSAGGTNRPSR